MRRVIYCKTCKTKHRPGEIEIFDPVTGLAVCPECNSADTATMTEGVEE